MSSNRRAPSSTSLRRRLSRSLLLGTGIILVVTGITIAGLVQAWLVSEFDRSLDAKAKALISLTDQKDMVVELDFVPELMPSFVPSEEPDYFQLWLDEDEVFERSPSLGAERSLVREVIQSPTSRFSNVALFDGRKGRQVQVDFVPQIDIDDEEDSDVLTDEPPELADGEDDSDSDGDESEDDSDSDGDESEAGDEDSDSERVVLFEPLMNTDGFRLATLVVASDRGELDERILLLRSALAGVSLTLMFAIALLVRFSVDKGLQPVSEVANEVEALDANRLGGRIESEPPEELVPLVGKLNELLARLQAAFDRERRFSSDVAHELRTPIAELRNLADVGGRWPDDRMTVQRFFGDVKNIAVQMEDIVVQLLALARSDAGIDTVAQERFQLGAMIDEIWERLAEVADRREMVLEREIPASLSLNTDSGKLELILHNLLANAVTYGRKGGIVGVRIVWQDEHLRVEVSNVARDLQPEDLPHVFDRFWRKEEARTTAAGHSGLGLSLVKALCELLGGEISASLDDGVVTFAVTLPPSAIRAEAGESAGTTGSWAS